jgi:hypothetical protein
MLSITHEQGTEFVMIITLPNGICVFMRLEMMEM